MTEWRDVPGYEGLYQASDTGLVRSVDRTVTDSRGQRRLIRGRVLKPSSQTRSGHRSVALSRGGRPTSHQVARVVLAAFVGWPTTDGLQCCHYDGDPLNNVPSNLRWDTASGNMLDAVRHGTLRAGPPTATLPPGDPRHGTVNGNINLKCHCIECRAAMASYSRHRRLRLRAQKEAS